MTLRLGLVILKRYRFEVSFAVVAALIAAGIGLSIDLRVDGLGVTQECIDQVNASEDGSGLEPTCFGLVRAGSGLLTGLYLNGSGISQVSLMGLLPFVLGMFGGIPVVARELEDRTAQTAWWLSGSRTRWLAQRVAPIAFVLGLSMLLAAGIASLVAEDWARWYGERAPLVGAHGIPAVARAFAAFGIGLLAGARLGRTFPAFVWSVAVLIALMFCVTLIRNAWLAQLPLEPLAERSPITGEWRLLRGEGRQVAWGGPDGEILTPAQARDRATEAGVPPPAADDPYDLGARAWFDEHGYAEIALGIGDRGAAGWASVDAGIFLLVGSTACAVAFRSVNRRRP